MGPFLVYGLVHYFVFSFFLILLCLIDDTQGTYSENQAYCFCLRMLFQELKIFRKFHYITRMGSFLENQIIYSINVPDIIQV